LSCVSGDTHRRAGTDPKCLIPIMWTTGMIGCQAGYHKWTSQGGLVALKYAHTIAELQTVLSGIPGVMCAGCFVMYCTLLLMINGRRKIQRALGMEPDSLATSALLYCCCCASCATCQEARAVKKAWYANGCKNLTPMAVGNMEQTVGNMKR